MHKNNHDKEKYEGYPPKYQHIINLPYKQKVLRIQNQDDLKQEKPNSSPKPKNIGYRPPVFDKKPKTTNNTDQMNDGTSSSVDSEIHGSSDIDFGKLFALNCLIFIFSIILASIYKNIYSHNTGESRNYCFYNAMIYISLTGLSVLCFCCEICVTTRKVLLVYKTLCAILVSTTIVIQAKIFTMDRLDLIDGDFIRTSYIVATMMSWLLILPILLCNLEKVQV